MRERELKPYYNPAVKGSDAVAPHAGARIETGARKEDEGWADVAPHAGARIETRCA